VVFVAVLILPLTLLMAFAIDTGNWWVHKRHLQTQADAGALGGGLGPWFPGCDEAGIEAKAREYAGDQSSTTNSQYTPSGNVTALINSTNYLEQGGSDFSDGGTPCQTLANATDSQPGFLDLKVTETNLANLFGSIPGFSTVTVHTHARVEIQASEEEFGVRPVAIRDDSAYQSAQILLYFANIDGTVGAQYGSAICLPVRTTHNPDQSDPTSYTQFTNSTGAPVTMPSPAQNLYVRAVLFANTACTGASETFPQDSGGSATGGLNFINVYSNGGTPASGDPPILRSVSVLPGNCSADQYFSSLFANPATPDPCAVTVKAFVDFPPGATTSGPGQNAFVRINGSDATVQADGSWQRPVSVSAETGPNLFNIDWEKQYDSVAGKTCKTNGNPSQCKGSFGYQQQSYAGTSDDTAASNSGTITLVQIGDGSPGVGANSFERSTSHSLFFTVRVGGLANSRPTDPPFVLRFAVQGQTNSKRTGIVDCWGNNSGAQPVYDAILTGCPRGIYLWTGGDCGPPPPNAAPDTALNPTDPIDCVGIVPGNRRGKVKQALDDRMGSACNNWNAWKASNGTLTNFPPVGDPRAMTMIVTPPADLSGNGGSTADVPVVRLATFYVTGWDGSSGNGQGCNNEKFPGKGSNKNAIWGHWIKYAPPGGIGNGKGCNPNAFGDCVAVLTQ